MVARAAGRRSSSVLAVAVLAAGASLLKSWQASLAFSQASPHSATANRSSLRGRVGFATLGAAPADDQGHTAFAGVTSPFWTAGAASFLAALTVSVFAPAPAAAGLFEEFGKLSYDEQAVTTATSKANTLVKAEKKAEQKAELKERQAAEKAAAEARLKKLDEEKTAEMAAKMETRIKQITELQKKNPKEAAKLKVQEEAEEKRAARLKEVRMSVLADVDQRRLEAKKAAEEAEAVAKKIEALAAQARAAAEAAKKLVDENS